MISLNTFLDFLLYGMKDISFLSDIQVGLFVAIVVFFIEMLVDWNKNRKDAIDYAKKLGLSIYFYMALVTSYFTYKSYKPYLMNVKLGYLITVIIIVIGIPITLILTKWGRPDLNRGRQHPMLEG